MAGRPACRVRPTTTFRRSVPPIASRPRRRRPHLHRRRSSRRSRLHRRQGRPRRPRSRRRRVAIRPPPLRQHRVRRPPTLRRRRRPWLLPMSLLPRRPPARASPPIRRRPPPCRSYRLRRRCLPEVMAGHRFGRGCSQGLLPRARASGIGAAARQSRAMRPPTMLNSRRRPRRSRFRALPSRPARRRLPSEHRHPLPSLRRAPRVRRSSPDRRPNSARWCRWRLKFAASG